MTFEDKIRQLKQFDQAYFWGRPIIEDSQYDLFKKQCYEENPDHPYFLTVGSKVRGNAVPLPYKMYGLNQIYENESYKWINKYNLHQKEIVTSEKLDGNSCQVIFKNGKLHAAFSRGTDTEGADITRHLLKIPSLPKKLKDINFLAARAEAIVKKDIFEQKHSKDYKTARGMVAGCLNKKETEQKYLDSIDIVFYELLDWSYDTTGLTKKECLNSLKEFGLKVVNYITIPANKAMSDENLTKFLKFFKDQSEYELDGIVLTVNEFNTVEKQSENPFPEHSVKYKVLDEDSIAITKVKNVHWKLSKSGYYKPRVEIEPVELFGTTVTYATGFNGKFIKDNMIDTGSEIKITKSGSVIPYILEVIKPCKTFSHPEEWKWDKNEVEFKSINESSDVIFMQCVHFFKTLEIDLLAETSLKKIIDFYDLNDLNFSKIVEEIIGLLDIEWERVLGVNGKKIYLSLHKRLMSMNMETLMGSVPFFGIGFGVRKAKKLLKQINFEDIEKSTIEKLSSLETFDTITANKILNGINEFNLFLKLIEDYIEFEIQDNNISQNLNGHTIVFTGFRNKELQKVIEDKGGRVTSAVSKKTTIVIAENLGGNSSKIKKAKELNIPVLDINTFNYQYIL